jgi:glycosyltransferase involved in cell wall biosynthesis
MKNRLVIITEIISPYRIPLFNALASRPEMDLHVIFLGETDPKLREWPVYKDEIRFSFQVLSSWRHRIGRYNALLNAGMWSGLNKADPHVIVCGGYSYFASWEALLWAQRHKRPFLLWSESNQQDQRQRRAPVEFLKRQFLHRCDGFIVPGKSAYEYVQAHDVGDKSIFIAPNAIDNQLYADAAEVARKNVEQHQLRMRVPQRYFLFVGRLVREKGVFELLSAYGRLDGGLRQNIGLVIVGDGPCRSQMQQLAGKIVPGNVVFSGFVHREDLGAYYGLAEVLILPTYTDTWGMVVNEAMACGLPVIVSEAAGCSADLIHENWNGMLIKPRDVAGLESAMKRVATETDFRRTMGTNSAKLIREYSPEAWAISVERSMCEAVGKP